MRTSHMNICHTCFAISLLFLYLPANAADIATDVRNGGARSIENGGHFEVGMIAGYVHNPYLNSETEDDVIATFDLGGEYRHRRLFLEASQGSQDGFNMGYFLWQNDDWSVDLLAASITGTISDRDDKNIDSEDNEAQRNRTLLENDTFHVGAGVRITRYINDYVVQYRLISDIFDNNGVISTLRMGRGWQVRNWNYQAIISAEYTSKKTNQYRVGVSQQEQTTRFPFYQPDASISYSALIGATRPLSENWLLRGFAGVILLPPEVKASPLVSDHNYSIAVATLVYVF